MRTKLGGTIVFILVGALIFPAPSYAAESGLTVISPTSGAPLSGNVDIRFNVNQPKKADIKFVCFTVDGIPMASGEELFSSVRVYSPGWGPGDPYGFRDTNGTNPKSGCATEYGFDPSTEQFAIEVSAVNTGLLRNGPHVLGIEAIYGDGTLTSGELSFIAENSTELELIWDDSLAASQPWGTSIKVGGKFGRASEIPPQKAEVRLIQKSGTTKWLPVSVVDGIFKLKTLKISSKTSIQVRAKFGTATRLFIRLINVKPAIRVTISNLYVAKRSTTKVTTTGMKTGMCQLDVNLGYSFYRSYPMPIKNGVGSIGFTFNSTGQYSGSVSCTGPGFVTGSTAFAQQISLG